MRPKHPTKARLSQEEALDLQQEIALAVAKAMARRNLIRYPDAYLARIQENTMHAFLGKRSRQRKRASRFTSLSALEASGKAEDVLAVNDRNLEHAQGAVTEEQILEAIQSFHGSKREHIYQILMKLVDQEPIRGPNHRRIAKAREALRGALDL